MANEVAYVNLIRGNTMKKYTGIPDEVSGVKPSEENVGRFSKDYSYSAYGVKNAKVGNKFAKTAEAGEIITLTANCGVITPSSLKVKISVVPEIYSYGLVSAPDVLEEGDDGLIKVKILLTKALDVSKISELIRIYVMV